LLTSSCFNHVFNYTLTQRDEKAARRVKIEFVENKIEITDIAKAQKITFPLQKIVSELYSNNENQEFKNKLLVQKSGEAMLLIKNLSAECKSSTDFKIQQLSFTVYLK